MPPPPPWSLSSFSPFCVSRTALVSMGLSLSPHCSFHNASTLPLSSPWYPSPSIFLLKPRAFSLSFRVGFFLLAYPEDFLRRAMRFCYINIGSISKRTPFYQPSPLPPFFVLLLRGKEARGPGGQWLYDARDLRKLKRHVADPLKAV